MNYLSLALLDAGLAGPAGPASSKPAPEPDAGSEVTLFTSARDGIVALTNGDNWRWAHTALDAAGFEKADDGVHAVPLGDADRTREVLLTLGVVAQITGATIVPSGETYIGDFARDLAEHLPGQWNARVENYSMRLWQGDLADCMWSEGPLAAALDQRQVRWAAVLRREDGTELAVIRDAQHDLYHVGALHPRTLPPDGLVPPPPGVSVPPAPEAAARHISSQLLPAYARAVLHCQVNSLEEDLDWARPAHAPAPAPEPPTAELRDAFDRFTTTAPHVTAAVRDLATLTAQQTAFLQRVDALIAAPSPAAGAPAAAAPAEPIAWWLGEGGQGLIDLARHTVPGTEPPAPKPSAPQCASTRALPPAPARGAPGPRR
ncbi:hypothetical protein ACFU99_12075 [Streptomyces sp. NPDC057654]|uniref:hypothetical protein n=1 Tax=Streptomyces sp. NPDC057654 TaxID=3346196 RepID=UPI003692222F